jgi:anti-sigma factor RsiW
MHCAEALRAQAYFDGELDAPTSVDVQRHAEHCARCRAQLQDLERMRIVLRRDSRYANTPPAFRARIAHALAKLVRDSNAHDN